MCLTGKTVQLPEAYDNFVYLQSSQARVVKSMCAFRMKNSTLEANFRLRLDAGLQVTTGSKQTTNLEK